jgi:hypothetical protein
MNTQLTNDICLSIGDLLEGYAIGALDPDEMLRVAEHISECPAQQEQLIQLEETVGLLGLGVTPVEPPAGLWDRLQESSQAPSAPAPIPLSGRSRSRVSVPRWLAVGLAAAAVILLISSVGLGMALRDANDDDPMFDSAMATYLTSGGQLVQLTSHETPEYLGWAGRGSLLTAPGMEPMVIVDRCVPSSWGYRYVVWLQTGDQRTPMGDIEIGEDGRGMIKLEGVESLANYDMLGISIWTEADHKYDVITGRPTGES